jgi:hypothetical protein
LCTAITLKQSFAIDNDPVFTPVLMALKTEAMAFVDMEFFNEVATEQ